MSEFYNNLPSHLRLPAAATRPVPAHVYQFQLQHHTLKIMLHRPFLHTTPSINTVQASQDPETVHTQSATFSAIRITYIINAYKNFYPLVSTLFRLMAGA